MAVRKRLVYYLIAAYQICILILKLSRPHVYLPLSVSNVVYDIQKCSILSLSDLKIFILNRFLLGIQILFRLFDTYLIQFLYFFCLVFYVTTSKLINN